MSTATVKITYFGKIYDRPVQKIKELKNVILITDDDNDKVFHMDDGTKVKIKYWDIINMTVHEK